MSRLDHMCRIVTRFTLVALLSMSLGGCVETVPEELVEAIESLDRDLTTLRASDVTPEAYSKFSRQWIALKGRVRSEENIVRWPWEDNELETDLEALQVEATQLVSDVNSRIQAQRTTAETKLAKIEQRLRLMNTRVGDIGSRVVLGEQWLAASQLLAPWTPPLGTGGEGAGEVLHGRLALRQPGEDRPAGRVGKRVEKPIESGLILFHKAKYHSQTLSSTAK